MGNAKSKNNNKNINKMTTENNHIRQKTPEISSSETYDETSETDSYYDETSDTETETTNDTSNTISEDELCTICFVNAINCELMPCKHKLYCVKCINKWNKTVDKKVEQMLNDIVDKDMEVTNLPNRSCPYCYKAITDVYTIDAVVPPD